MKPKHAWILLAACAILLCAVNVNAEPARLIGGVYYGADHHAGEGVTKQKWFGFFQAVKTAEIVQDKVWLYSGFQYGDATTKGSVDNWGGNVRLVFRGDLIKGSFFWVSTGWLNHIAERGVDFESGLTAYVGGSVDLGSGFNLMTEYGLSDRGPAFNSEWRIGVGIDYLWMIHSMIGKTR